MYTNNKIRKTRLCYTIVRKINDYLQAAFIFSVTIILRQNNTMLAQRTIDALKRAILKTKQSKYLMHTTYTQTQQNNNLITLPLLY